MNCSVACLAAAREASSCACSGFSIDRGGPCWFDLSDGKVDTAAQTSQSVASVADASAQTELPCFACDLDSDLGKSAFAAVVADEFASPIPEYFAVPPHVPDGLVSADRVASIQGRLDVLRSWAAARQRFRTQAAPDAGDVDWEVVAALGGGGFDLPVAPPSP